MQAEASPEDSSRSLNPNTSLVARGHVHEQHHMSEETGRIALDGTEKRPLRTALTHKTAKQLDPFQYTELPTSGSIRLLEILPSTGGSVRCNMRTVNLKDEPCFNVLSYTWGNPLWRGLDALAAEYETCSDEIECDGRALKVHKNLYNALLQLSKKIKSIVNSFKDKNQYHKVMIMLDSLRKIGAAMCSTRYWEVNYIWIDAICINQRDSVERHAQVSIMGDIYCAAQSVVVWLGPHDKQADEAIRVCHLLESIPFKKWRNIRSIRDEKIYRELGIPCISQNQWQAFAAFAQTFKAVSLQKDHKNSAHMMTDNCANVACIQALRKRDPGVSFWSLSATLRNCMAQDPRGSACVVLDVVDIPVNTNMSKYGKSTSEKYSEAAWPILDEIENLQLLGFVADISKPKIDDLPSWVPDWSARIQPSPLHGRPYGYGNRENESCWHRAGGHRWFHPRGNLGSGKLTVPGLQVDTVLAAINDLTDAHNLHTILELTADQLQSAPQGLSSIGASKNLWRTSIPDTVCQKPAIETHSDMIQYWFNHTLWEICPEVSDSDSLELKGLIERTKSAAWYLT